MSFIYEIFTASNISITENKTQHIKTPQTAGEDSCGFLCA